MLAMKKAAFELKSRITGSSVMQNISPKDRQDFNASYQTFQHSVHQNFGEVERMDPKLVAEQKTRLSKHNFLLGLSPPAYTSTNVAEHA